MVTGGRQCVITVKHLRGGVAMKIEWHFMDNSRGTHLIRRKRTGENFGALQLSGIFGFRGQRVCMQNKYQHLNLKGGGEIVNLDHASRNPVSDCASSL